MVIGWLLLSTVVVALLLLLRACERANRTDWGGPWLNRLEGFNRLFCRWFHRLDPEPLHLPESGPALLACNHLSGLDPLLLIASSPRPLSFIIAAEEYHRFGFTWLFRATRCIPVERSGRPEKAFREALKVLQRGEVVAIFPHGRIHLDDDPPRPLKAGVARLAQLADCPVTPARITGVTGVRQTVLAVFRRSRAHVASYPPLDCMGVDEKGCLAELERLISGRTTSAE